MDKITLLKKVENLDAKGLKNLLRELKLYQDLQKKLWDRGVDLFERKHSGKKQLVVEYFPSLWEESAWKQAENVYSKVFNLDTQREKIKFVSKESIKWWMKIYFDDSMVDLSFEKIEKQVRN